MVGSFVQAYLTSDAVGWVTSFPRWMFSSTLSLAIGTCVAVALHFQLIITLRVAAAAAISWGTRTFLLSLHPQARTAAQGILLAAAFTLSLITPLLDSAAVFLFPTRELVDALSTVEAASQVAATTATAGVSGVLTLRRTVYELVFVTICIQVSMGFIGIDYMKAGQIRKLALLSMGPDKGSKENAKNPLTSRLFLKKSGKYILFTALPYMLWRGSMETANTLAFSKMQQQVETDFLHVLFQQTTAGATTNEAEFPSSTVRLQQVASSNYTVSSYTESISDITKTSFSLFSRKCFSVPKMALFPGYVCCWFCPNRAPPADRLIVARPKFQVVHGATCFCRFDSSDQVRLRLQWNKQHKKKNVFSVCSKCFLSLFMSPSPSSSLA